MAVPQPARPPRKKRPPSGAARQQAARQAALIVAAIILAVELAILAALAASVLAVLTGILLASVGARRLRMAAWQAIAQAEPQLRAAITSATGAVSADVQQAVAHDLGALSRLLRPLPPARVPQLHTDLHNALLTALGDADAAYWRITRHLSTLPPGEREAAAQALLSQLAQTGLTGLTDVTGRDWNLTAYARVATAGGIGNLHTALQLAAYQSAGVDLVLVTRSDPRPPCPKCAPYVGRVLSITGRTVGTVTIADASGRVRSAQIMTTVADARRNGLLHPMCFPADVLVSAPSGVRTAYSRWYEGDLVVIHTASGNELPVTPNHPVLTPEGWVAAGSLKVGQRVVRDRRMDERVGSRFPGVRPGDQQVESRIGDVYDALRESGQVAAVRVPAAAEQFHGDGFNSDVDVVFADRLLWYRRLPGLGQEANQGQFVRGGRSRVPLPPDSGSAKRSDAALAAPARFVRGGSERQALFGRHPREATAHGVALGDLDAAFDELLAEAGLLDTERGCDCALRLASPEPRDGFVNLGFGQTPGPHGPGLVDLPGGGGQADTEGGGDLLHGLAGAVELDEIVSLGRRQVATHVYNLQTGDGWYTANKIIVHNCRDSLSPFMDGAHIPARIPHGPAGDPGVLRTRALATARREHALAITPQAKRRAARRIRFLR